MNLEIVKKTKLASVYRIKDLLACETLPKESKTQLKRYLKQHKKGDTFDVTCNRSIKNFGRLRASPEGLQTIQRNCRCYISAHYYHAVDMVNCAPTILLHLFHNFKLSSPTLEAYVQDRSKILEEHKVPKQDVISMLFSKRVWTKDPFFIEMHKDTYERLIPILQKDELFGQIWAIVKKSQKKDYKDNKEGSFLSQSIYYLEDQVLMHMEIFLDKHRWVTEVLCSDGLQIRRQPLVTLEQSLLDECSEFVFEQCGIRIAIKEKPITVDADFIEEHGLDADFIEEHGLDMEDLGEDDPLAGELPSGEKELLFLQPIFPELPHLDKLARLALSERSDGAIARFVTMYWRHDFFVDDKHWYYFQDHIWRKDTSGHHLVNILMNELYDLFDERCQWRKGADGVTECLKSLKITLNSTKDCRNIRDACRTLFAMKDTETFLKSLDSNLHLMAFKNGVYDFKKDEFRKGRASDYISMQIQYDYKPFNDKDEIAIELRDILSRILPDEDLLTYVLTLLSSCLNGSTLEEMPMFCGGGANAKSFLLGLLEEVLGPYATSWSTSMITQDFDICKTHPEMASGQFSRFFNMQEGKAGKVLNMEMVKRFTGGDKVRARNLFENGDRFVIYALIILSVNDLPTVVELDRGTWSRLRVIPFTSIFTDNVDEVDEEKHIYLADQHLKRRFEEFAPYFMAMLIEFNKVFRKEGLKVPEVVKMETEAFRISQNVYEQFVDDMCKISMNDETFRIHAVPLWSSCKKWAQQNGINGVDRKGLKKYLIKRPGIAYKEKLKIVWNGKTKASNGYTGKTINAFERVGDEDEKEEDE